MSDASYWAVDKEQTHSIVEIILFIGKQDLRDIQHSLNIARLTYLAIRNSYHSSEIRIQKINKIVNINTEMRTFVLYEMKKHRIFKALYTCIHISGIDFCWAV